MRLKSIIPLFTIACVLQITVFAQTSEALINQVQAAIAKQDYSSALQAIETVLKTEPKNDSALAEKARVLYFQKKIAEALAEIEKALAVNPKNFVALNVRGLIKTQNNDDAGAVTDFTAAINANPSFSKAYANRATANIRLKAKQDLIITDFLKARELDPTNAAIAKEIAVFCLNQTDFGCKPEIEDLMKLSPNGYSYYLRGLRELDRVLEKGSIYTNYQESSAKALADFEKAIALDKKIADYPNFYRQFGRIHYFAKNYITSIENLNKQITTDAANNKKSAWNFIHRSQTYLAMSDSAAALKDFDEMEKIDSKIPQIYLWRGDYFRDTKDYDKALIEYKKFNQLFDGSYANWKLAYVYGLKKDYANAETNLKLVWAQNNGTRSSWIKNADFRVPNCQKITLEAEIELNKGNSEKAGSLFYQASNEDHDTDAKCMANAAYQQGSLVLQRFPLSAIDAFKKANRLDPTRFPDAQGKIDQAKERDRQIVAASSNNGGGNSGDRVINDTKETNVNGLKDYYKQAFQKLGISVAKEGTAVNTSTSYRQLTVEANLETGYVYHFVAICPEKVFVSGEGDEYQEYFESGSFGKSSVPQKYGLTSYFYTAAYQGKNSNGAFTFKPTRQKVYWILFRSKRNSTKSNDEISQTTSDSLDDEDLKRIQDIERNERIKSAVAGLPPEQRRKAAEALTKMNADEKKVNETAAALVPVMTRKQALEQSFSGLYDKLQSDTKNRVTYAVQMKKDAEEIVKICEQFLSKYGTELGKTDLPSLNAKVDVINQQIREMRNDIVENKKNIERLEKIIKANN